MSISNLGALVKAKPDEARALILAALEGAEGNRKEAAKKLGTTHRSFYRFVERLNLWREIDKMMREKGFVVVQGPTRSADRVRDALKLHDGNIDAASEELGLEADEVRERIKRFGLSRLASKLSA